MRVVLITPPHSNPTGPTLGTAVLSSFIKDNFDDVEINVEDLSIKSFLYLLSPNRLLYYREKIDNQILELEARPRLVYEDLLSLKKKHIALHRLDTYIEEVEDSIKVLRNPRLFNMPEKREKAIMIVNALLNSIGEACSNQTILSAGDYRTCLSPFSTSDILSYIKGTDNPYYNFFHDWLKQYDFKDVSMVGISISFAKQMLPAIQLAKMIKENYPSVFIQLGGSMMAHLKAEKFAPILHYCDAIVQREGEMPLFNTIRKIKLKAKLDSKDGAIMLDELGKLVFPQNVSSIDVTKESTPDFSTINFNDYLVPYPVVPIQIGRTCYWGKCSFCCLNAAFSHKHLWRTAEQIVNYIEEIILTYHVDTFEFVDDAIPPRLSEKISDLLLQRHLNVRWFSYARFDSGFTKELLQKMHNAGCVGLKFGLESASPRVLALMNKGTNLQDIQSILLYAKESRMHCQVGFFVGFPTETKEDREMTVKFLHDVVVPNGGVLTYNGWFRILKDMPIIQREEFRCKISKWNMSEDLIDYYVFDSTTFEDMQEFSMHLKKELFGVINTDYVRSVDKRRYWFSGLCSIDDFKYGNEGEIQIYSHFDLNDIIEYRDKRFDDFRPGKGIYATKSYISSNLLDENTLAILNGKIFQNARKKTKIIILKLL